MAPRAPFRLGKKLRISVMVLAMAATGGLLLILGDRGPGLAALFSSGMAAFGQWKMYEN